MARPSTMALTLSATPLVSQKSGRMRARTMAPGALSGSSLVARMAFS